jgi:predicted kinase
MASPLLVVIQGAPGSGKSTLAHRLRQDVSLPLLGKDDIKELLFDHLPQADKEYSRLQGMASFEMLYAFARTFLQNGHSVVIEGAFHTELSRKNIGVILEETGAKYLEIFCDLDEEIRKQRFLARSQDGSRHPAHMDTVAITPTTNYQQLGLGECIRVDTSAPITEEAYSGILEKLRSAAQARSG